MYILCYISFIPVFSYGFSVSMRNEYNNDSVSYQRKILRLYFFVGFYI